MPTLDSDPRLTVLELVSLSINSDLCRVLLLHAEVAVRGRAEDAIMRAARSAASSNLPGYDALLRLLFQVVLCGIPHCFLLRNHSQQYFNVLMSIISLALTSEFDLFPNQEADIVEAFKSDSEVISLDLASTELLDLLCSLLALCPVFESRTDGHGHDRDHTLAGLCTMIAAMIDLICDGTSFSETEEAPLLLASTCRRIGCVNGLVPLLLETCLSTESIPVIAKAPNRSDNKLSLGDVIISQSRAVIADVLGILDGCVEETVSAQRMVAAPMAKLEATRDICHSLLLKLCRGSVDCAELAAEFISRSSAFTPTVTTPDDFPIYALDRVIDSVHLRVKGLYAGHVGIANPDSVCYASSVVQILFCAAELRATVLSLDIERIGANSTFPNEAWNIVSELQHLFTRMLYGHSAVVSVERLVGVMTDDDGVPFTLCQQRDAVRVMTKILHAIEQVGSVLLCDSISQTKQGKVHFLKHIVSGDFVHEFTGELGAFAPVLPGGVLTPTHLRFCRFESFYYLGARVSPEISTLDESLHEFFSATSAIPGFDWKGQLLDLDPHKDTVLKFNTEKKTRLAVLPRSLMIHIQRYDFDYEKYCQVKVNSSLSFPESLHLRASYLQPQLSEVGYHLRSVLLHSGLAMSGHYKAYTLFEERSLSQAAMYREQYKDVIHAALRMVLLEVGASLVPSVNCDTKPTAFAETATLNALTALLTARPEQPKEVVVFPPPPGSATADGGEPLLDMLELLALTDNDHVEEFEGHWEECDDEAVSRFDIKDLPDTAFGWKDETDYVTTKRKKHKKKNTSAIPQKSTDGRSNAMLLLYQRKCFTNEKSNTFLNIKNVAHLMHDVIVENKTYWENVNNGERLDLMSLLCGFHAHSIALKSTLQQLEIRRGLRGAVDINMPPVTDLLPGSCHWLLSVIRAQPSLLYHGPEITALILYALRTALGIHPLYNPTVDMNTSINMNEVQHLLNRIPTMDEVRNHQILSASFCSPFMFVRSLLQARLLENATHESSRLECLDVIQVLIDHGDGARNWLLAEGVIHSILNCFESPVAGDFGTISRRLNREWERHALIILSGVLRPSAVHTATTSIRCTRGATDDVCSDDEAEVNVSGFDSLSEDTQNLLLTPATMNRLFIAMDCQRMRVIIGNVLSFVVHGSRERSKAVATIAAEAIRSVGRSDISELPAEANAQRVAAKSLVRFLIVQCSAFDELVDMRIDLVMSAVIGALETCVNDLASRIMELNCKTTKIKEVLRISGVWMILNVFIDMLPRCCRLCPTIGTWIVQNDDCLQFFIDFIKSMPQNTKLVTENDISVALAVLNNMSVVSADHSPQKLQLNGKVDDAANYYIDSDDEPQTLIGRRISVVWSGGRAYSGTVSAYDPRTGLHDVLYDDNERKSYTLSNAFSARSVSWNLEKKAILER